MAKKVYVGQINSKNKGWLSDAGDYIQDIFQKHGHNFILIPAIDVDDVTSEKLENGDIQVGTCLTDVQDPVSFAVAIAGAISSYGLTSKDKGSGEAAIKLAETVLDIVKQVKELKR